MVSNRFHGGEQKVYINSLRGKLNVGGKPDIIHIVRGAGYVLKPKPSGPLQILEKE